MSENEAAALKGAREMSNRELIAGSLDDAIQRMMEWHAEDRVEIDLGKAYVLGHETRSQSFAEIPDDKDLVEEYTFAAPGSGPMWRLVEAFGGHSWNGSMNCTIRVPATQVDDRTVAKLHAEFEQVVTAAAGVLNQSIDNHRDKTESQLRLLLKGRYERATQLKQSANERGLLLRPLSFPVEIPVTPTDLDLDQVNERVNNGEKPYVLADAIAVSIVTKIRSFAIALGNQPKVASHLVGQDEEAIRDILLFIINSNWGNQATGETFVGAGKTDILLRWNEINAFTAECKIWSGSSDFHKAIDQLLSYMVWQNTRAALVLFIRDIVDVTAIIEKARKVIVDHPQHVKPGDLDDEYIVSSTSDTAREIRLSFIPVHVPGRDAASSS